MSHPKAISVLLNQIAEIGIWMQRHQDGNLVVGPTNLAKQHAELIAELRPHKQVIAQLIESQLAHALFGDADDDPRFETAECPVCKQTVYVMALDGEPRRLSVHRTDGQTVSPVADGPHKCPCLSPLMPFSWIAASNVPAPS